MDHVRRSILLVALATVVGLTARPAAQGGFFGDGYEPRIHNVKYDGRFTFVRLRYTVGPNGYYYRGMPAWAHGYPKAEDNMLRILDAITAVHPRVDESNVLSIDDPDLFQYPVAFMTEAGYWEMTDAEAAIFRAYFEKGGFVIFDDFRDPPRGGGGWHQFASNMRRILPAAEIVDLTPADTIFHVFFDIDSFDIIPQSYDMTVRPYLSGIFEDNDRQKRLIAVINFNTDVSDFWEFSGDGFMPVSESNEAYKLGVNYMVYGLTH